MSDPLSPVIERQIEKMADEAMKQAESIMADWRKAGEPDGPSEIDFFIDKARELAEAAYRLGLSTERERCAPYMQHLPDCKKWTTNLRTGGPLLADWRDCTCGLAALRTGESTT